MKAQELKAYLVKNNLNQSQFARMIGRSRRQVNRWINGFAPVPKYIELIVK